VNYALYVIAAWVAIGSLVAIGHIGKPRDTITPKQAARWVVIDAAVVVVLVLAALRLS
jgi:ribosomal silencing factor RsfS